MLAILAAVVAVAPVPADETVTLKLTSEKAMQKIGFYAPLRVNLTADKPASITKAPADLASPMYGVLQIASEGNGTYHVILDEPADKPARLFIDANGNGDLTDDPAAEWKPQTTGEGDKKTTMYNGTGSLNLGTAAKPYQVGLGLYRFDKNDPAREALKNVLLYYRDYAVEGEMKLGGKTYNVLLNDNQATGDFRGKELAADAGDKASSGINLMIDVNGNGKFEKRGETFDVRKPFNIGGVTYEIADMARNGLTFKVAKSSKTVAEVPLAPNHTAGQKITPFEAQTTAGKTVAFPNDYKGKIVMIDFWATWCGPCMKEVPGLVTAYNKFHDQGFEVLGISLDNDKTMPKLEPVTKEKGMTWTQVADGKGWDAVIAKMYVVDSIPACWLVDGDTGEILAEENALRGDRLQPTLEKHLAAKKKAGS